MKHIERARKGVEVLGYVLTIKDAVVIGVGASIFLASLFGLNWREVDVYHGLFAMTLALSAFGLVGYVVVMLARQWSQPKSPKQLRLTAASVAAGQRSEQTFLGPNGQRVIVDVPSSVPERNGAKDIELGPHARTLRALKTLPDGNVTERFTTRTKLSWEFNRNLDDATKDAIVPPSERRPKR